MKDVGANSRSKWSSQPVHHKQPNGAREQDEIWSEGRREEMMGMHFT